MSIYATLWEIVVPRFDIRGDEWVCVYAQAVPAHIGHPSRYPDGDPYADYLPPVVQEFDPETERMGLFRAVVILQDGRNNKNGQRYADPLLVLSGAEYASMPFQVLMDRIRKAIDWNRCAGVFFMPDEGKKPPLVEGELQTEDTPF